MWRKSKLRFIATCILVYPIAFALIFGIVEDIFGPGQKVILSLIDLIPFGELITRLAVSVINMFLSMNIEMDELHTIVTFGDVLEELTIGIFTIMIYESLDYLFIKSVELKRSRDAWDGLEKILLKVAAALIAANIAPYLINYILDFIKQNSGCFVNFLYAFIIILISAGGFFFVIFLYGFTILMGLLYYVLKFIAVPSIKLIFIYLSIIIVCILWALELYIPLIISLVPLLMISIIIAALDLMIDSTFRV